MLCVFRGRLTPPRQKIVTLQKNAIKWSCVARKKMGMKRASTVPLIGKLRLGHAIKTAVFLQLLAEKEARISVGRPKRRTHL